ncbi:hypothetical protein FOXYSP1_01543 [Fusarium oxysporum f. sp. phaseoli]
MVIVASLLCLAISGGYHGTTEKLGVLFIFSPILCFYYKSTRSRLHKSSLIGPNYRSEIVYDHNGTADLVLYWTPLKSVTWGHIHHDNRSCHIYLNITSTTLYHVYTPA